MINIENKIISYREDTNDYRLCLTREDIDEIKNIRTEIIAEISREIRLLYGNEYEQQIRAEAIEEVANEVLNLPTKYIDNFDYVSVALILNKLEQLKEQK